MITLTTPPPPVVSPTLADLRQRLTDLYIHFTQLERTVHDDIDPAWTACARLVTTDLDAAQEALVQADLARTGGDPARAKRRLAYGWERLTTAGNRLAEWEAERGTC